MDQSFDFLSLEKTIKEICKNDTQLYERVYNLLFDEMLLFVDEHLSSDQKNELFARIDSIISQELPDQQIEEHVLNLVLQYLKDIPNARFQLESRLTYFLSTLTI